jgi:hypothetical protein
VETAGAQQVECDGGLWENPTPQLEGEGGVYGTQTGDEMIFERLDGAFGIILSVHAGWRQLVSDRSLVDFVFHGCRTLVIQDVVLGFESSDCEGVR